ncbi:hypothetical protein ACPXB5_07600 [Micromonospora arida]|uniref:hypothetical protein n=1 Tax=Micromonospora arida TaxID=2203715 RepID=UPI000F5DE8A1|nr:hypothetical protein [Micromonospora arida]
MRDAGFRLSPAQIAAVVERAQAGESLTRIANSYGVSRQAVRGLLRRRGVPARSREKLTESERSEAVRQYAEGLSVGEVAKNFGFTEPGMRGLLVRRGVVLRKTVHTLRHDAFDRLTPEACYWLGFLFADGCVTYRAGHLPQISVGLAQRDREHLVSLRTFLGSTSSISAPSPTHGSCQFSVRSNRLAERLTALGRYDGPLNDRLTESRDFWRGVVDGDGSIGKYRRPSPRQSTFSQFRLVGSKRLLDSFAAFLQKNDIEGLSVRPHKTIYTIGTTCGPAEKIVALLYAEAEIALARKAEMAKKIFDG